MIPHKINLWRSSAVVAALALSPTWIAAQSAEPVQRFVRSAIVNVRTQPDAQATVVARLPINTPVTVSPPVQPGARFCSVRVANSPVTQGFMACDLLGSAPISAKELDAEFARAIQDYDAALARRHSPSQSSPDPKVTAFLADPSPLLAVLERRFYLTPSIESLAWYGSVAEDVAYLNTPATSADGTRQPWPAMPWLTSAKSTWANMVAFLEAGWPAGQPWARDGRYAYTAVQWSDDNSYLSYLLGDMSGGIALLKTWLPPTRTSWLKADGDALFLSGEPLTKRRLLRKSRTGGADGAVYSAEASWTLKSDRSEAQQPRSTAGGFRSLGSVVEFLKSQSQPLELKFERSRQYGIDGLLGVVGARLHMPASVNLYAITQQGVVPGHNLTVTSDKGFCGPSEGVTLALAAPAKSLPLAYFASLAGLKEPARAVVKPLGERRLKTTSAWMGDGTARLRGWQVDLDADGATDLVVINGVFPATLGISDTYAHGDSGIFSVVYANIGGVWKLVAHAIEAGCT